ncbi:MAG: hypothetical protein JW750_05425 [Anaerolineaceae bacterium]|nr:hypothetical protein [Anaerolineaceae bacterium]
MTTPRDLILQTLYFEQPERIPRDLWSLPWADLYHPDGLKKIREDFPSDFTAAPGFHERAPKTIGDPYKKGIYVDEWGCTFTNYQDGVIGEVKTPLVLDWKTDLEKVVAPTELLEINIEKVNEFCANTDKFVLNGFYANPFERLQYIRGSQNLYIDLAEQPDELIILRDRLHAFYMSALEKWCQTDIDGVSFMDDWGSQKSLLISPRMWRKLFKPLYQEYIEMAHSYGKFVFMHSDGFTEAIYPELIEIGLDAFNSQLFVMDIEHLGAEYGGKITFWGEIDRQHLLPYGSKEDIQNAVKRVYKACYKEGGVIAQCEFGAGANPDNVYTVFETWNQIHKG